MRELTVAELHSIAVEAVDRATHVLHSRAPGEVTMKSDRNPATEVDYAIEREIRDFLLATAPDVDFLGEEHGRVTNNGSSRVWALDPVDGTVNFAHGLPMCGVALGLVQDQRPAVGVMSFPFLGLRYSSALGHGAYCGSDRLRVSDAVSLGEAVVALGDYAVGDGAREKNRERIQITDRLAQGAERVRMFGSASIDLAWVAHGRLGASVMLSNKPWDSVAGVILAREAGALVVDRYGRDHTFDSCSTVALAPALLHELIPLLS